MPGLQQQMRYQFLNEKRTAGFLLDHGGLSFQTSEYGVFSQFSAAFLQGLRILHESVELSYSDRLGLRYLDAVCPTAEEKLSQYLKPSMLGLFENIGGRKLIHSQTETKTSSDNVYLLGRVTILDQLSGEVAFPVELRPKPLSVVDKFKDIKGVYAIIDTDSWIEGREKFDLSNLEKSLARLQTETRFSFDQMVTAYALKVWS
jgi:uncharacterized protein (TIGR04255 family)